MKIHIVQKGDTLWNIAKKYNVDFDELKNLNNQLSNPDMIYPGMKIKIPSSTTMVQQAQSYKEQPIKEQPLKEHPMKEQPAHMKEEVVQVIEQPQIKTYPISPTNIHQDIYQIDLVNVVNEKEQTPQQTAAKPKPMPKPVKIPEVKPTVPPAKPKATEAPVSKPVKKSEKQEAPCHHMMVQPVQQEVSCQTMCAPIPQEMSCNMMIQPQIPCMPYPFFVPCMPMPVSNCWPVYTMPQANISSCGMTQHTSAMKSQMHSASECGCCSVNQEAAAHPMSYQVGQQPVAAQSSYHTNQEVSSMYMNPSMQQASGSPSSHAAWTSAMPNMYGKEWQGQYASPYISSNMQSQGMPTPYVPTPRNVEG